MGLNMREKQAVTAECKPRYQKASEKDKKSIPDEFTGLAGCRRKSAARVLGAKPIKQVVIYKKGKAVKIKPGKKHPANRKGKRVYTDEVIDRLRLVWTFFWYKCGRTKVRRSAASSRRAGRKATSGITISPARP